MIDQLARPQTPSEREALVEKLAPRQILQLITVVSSSADLDGALRNLVDSLAMMYGNDQICIFTPDKANVFTFFFSGGKEFINLENRKIKSGEGILGSALKNLKTFLVEDYAINKEFLPVPAGISSELVVPIMFQSKLIALLDIINQAPNSFSTHDQTTLEALAASLGGVLFTLQKTQDLKENADREDRVSILFTELSKAGTVEDSIKVAAREIAKMPEVSQVLIYINPVQKPGSK